jgi:hypothetical protein
LSFIENKQKENALIFAQKEFFYLTEDDVGLKEKVKELLSLLWYLYF